jgi:hypothetical protein
LVNAGGRCDADECGANVSWSVLVVHARWWWSIGAGAYHLVSADARCATISGAF